MGAGKATAIPMCAQLFYQGLIAVPSSISLLKNFPVGAFSSVSVCLIINAAAAATVPGGAI